MSLSRREEYSSCREGYSSTHHEPTADQNIPVAVVRGDSKVTGTVHFEQTSKDGPTTITYDLSGNDASAEVIVHTDLSQGLEDLKLAD